MANIEMDVDAVLGNNNNNEENLPPKEGENGQLKISTKNKKYNNTLLDSFQKESEITREVIKKAHDHIREALSVQNKAIVQEILHEINPRFVEIENSLVELKNAVRALSANESETDSDSDSVNGQENDEIEEEPLIQENSQQQAAQQPERENGQENRREARERGNNRGRPRGGPRARDARIFFLLRQLERERAFGGNNRFDPYLPGRGGYGGGNRGGYHEGGYH